MQISSNRLTQKYPQIIWQIVPLPVGISYAETGIDVIQSQLALQPYTHYKTYSGIFLKQWLQIYICKIKKILLPNIMLCSFYFAVCHLQGGKEVQIIMSIVICNIFHDGICISRLYDFEWLDNSEE
jgi:hypothetical protein